jgi:hypothetical protein
MDLKNICEQTNQKDIYIKCLENVYNGKYIDRNQLTDYTGLTGRSGLRCCGMGMWSDRNVPKWYCAAV